MPRKIVIVEDNPADSKILRLALSERDPTIEMVVLEDGSKAIDFFTRAQAEGEISPCDLVLLDLNLPRVSGFEVLEFLKGQPGLKKIPVVVLSGSSSETDIERCYASCANSYVCKPIGIDEVYTMAAHLISYWFDCAKRPSSLRAFSAI
jgi:chemotaxis family two-component system response regulator Rcp1